MKNVLVTGGLGYIGSHTAVELVSAGYNPIVIDNLINSRKSVTARVESITGKPLTFYKGDYQDRELLSKILKKENIIGVIHFAAHKDVGESVKNPLKYYQNNVAGLVTLLDGLLDGNVNSFIFSSSCTVYGEPDHLPVSESAPLKPAESPYGATKQMGETIIHDTTNTGGLKATALRYFNPIGAHPSAKIGELPIGTPANLVPFITQAAAKIRPHLTVFGNDYSTADGTCIRDYIHVVDLAKAHIRALEYTAKQNDGYYEVINIGTGKGSSVLEVIETFQRVTGVKVPYRFGPRRSGDIVSSYADAKMAKNILNWKAQKSLENALEDAWRWQKTLK